MINKDWALNYLKNSLSVFPTQGKKPLVKWEPYSKTKPAEDQVNEWWTKKPDADIACATGQVSNLIVIDVDGGEVPPLPPTTVSETSPGGHYQYFFKYPGFPVANSTKFIGPNIDVRGDGGFAVLPPSNHYDKEGKVDFTYKWLITPKEAGFAELPQWILEKLKEQKRFDPKVLEGVTEGKRNESAASVIGKILHGLKPEEWKVTGWELVTAWNERNKPPLSEKELRNVFESISKREAQKGPVPSPLYTPSTEIVRVFEPILAKNIKTLSNIAVDWVVEGLLAKDNLSLLAAREKMGKTSLLEELLIALVNGGYFLGLKVTKSKVVVISEEPNGIWNMRLENTGLAGCDTLWIKPRPFNTRLKLRDWETWLIEGVAPFCEKNQIDVLILDTISPIWPVLHENDASEVQTALLPLNAIAEKNISVLAIHHYNKAGGIRGSTVLGAVPSILLDFGKPPGDEETTKRLLKVRSRFDESPDQLLVDYENGEYFLLGTPQNVVRQEKLKQVKTTLAKFPSGATIKEILSKWDGEKPSRTTLKRWLDDLCFTQSVYQIGTKIIAGGEADIFSLYPNQSNNGEGIGVLAKNEANNPNHFGKGSIYKQGSSKVDDAIAKALKKQKALEGVEVHES